MIKLLDILKEGMYGNYLFGDKDTGAKVGIYSDEIEPDTPTEKDLFNLLKQYADSEFETYSKVSLDDFIPVLKKLKKQYPDIVNPNISSETYIYRGTSFTEEQMNKLKYKEEDIKTYEQGIIIPNQTYSSKRKVQSWSTSYFTASGFAFMSADKRGGQPIILRTKAVNADLYFKPEVMDKISTQAENETFNIVKSLPVDVMVVKEYKDEFEDIESTYLHTK